MCKKNLFFSAVSIIAAGLLFFSCSSESQIDLNSGSDETLRMTFSSRNSEVIWSREIESSLLSKKINTSSYVSSNLKLDPEVYMISSTDEEPVYPSIDGFGSLDSTKISPEVKKIVDSFAQNVISWNFDENLIQKNSIFSLAMFKYDVESGWKNNFNEDFPLTAEKKLFSSYYCGEPFVDEEFLSVPLRFKTPKKFIDVQIFIDKTENFKITQILVKKWGK